MLPRDPNAIMTDLLWAGGAVDADGCRRDVVSNLSAKRLWPVPSDEKQSGTVFAIWFTRAWTNSIGRPGPNGRGRLTHHYE
jgi:hypothetical protein